MKAKDFFNLDKQRDRQILGFYIIWIVLNVLIFIGSSHFIYRNGLFPFYFDARHWLYHYDYTELLFYTISPIILFIAYKLIKPVKEK